MHNDMVQSSPIVATVPNASTSVSNAPHTLYGTFSYGSPISGYIINEQIGEGTFGVVLKARQKSSNKIVAIKRLTTTDSSQGFHITSIREIKALKSFKHKNLIQLTDIIAADNDVFYLVFPFMWCDLAGIISNLRISLPLPEIKNFMTQLLEGINYIHQHKFIHRDMKTSNILISSNNLLKIADFGLTRTYDGPIPVKGEGPGAGTQPLTTLVVARWYRAPELLLGDSHYTTAIDMWAIGCIFGEFYVRKPIMTGQSDLDQLNEIFKVVGSPTKGRMPLFDKLAQERLLNDH